MIKRRDYQQWARDAFFAYFSTKAGNPIIALPTGTGKSVVIADISIEVITTWPGQRILVLAPSKELVSQNAAKFHTMAPALPVGVCSASLDRFDLGLPITIGTIGTVINRLPALGWIDLVFIDECHLVSQNEETQYRKLADHLIEQNPYCKFVGLSATPYRLGLGLLTQGGLFTDICFDATSLDAFNWFIDQGYLAPVVPHKTRMKIETEGVKTAGGDFVASALQRAVNKQEVTEAAVAEALESLSGREHVLWFATGIEHAESIRLELEARGETAVCVHSKSATRDADLTAFKAGKARHCVNFGVMTTGFDFPALDAIVVMRPTKSPGLWVQMLGRGTRPDYVFGMPLETAEERLLAIAMSAKRNCLVLDFAYNTQTLGPINDPRLPRKKGTGVGEAVVKTCGWSTVMAGCNIVPETSDPDRGGGPEGCSCWNHPSARKCVQCGAEFIFEVKFKTTAATDDLLKRKSEEETAYEKPIIEEHKVTRVSYEIHKKEGRPDSIKVLYYCGLRRFSHYVLPEHGGNPRRKSIDWWERHGGGKLPESTLIARAQVDRLKTPKRISVWIRKEYPEVVDWIFEDAN